jgi:predicted GNAT family N-acyltransferase
MNGSKPATLPTSTSAPMNDNGTTSIPAGITMLKTTWQDSEASLRSIREAVFIREQRVPEEMEWDEFDADSIHFLALNAEQHAVGCVRLLHSGQISRLCVSESLRGQGIGRLLLETVENEARQQSMSEVFLHAQTQASHFYEAAGFMVNGGIFVEAGIPHRQMTKELCRK